jgi:phage-related protein
MGDLHLPAYPPIYPISKVVKPRQRKAKMPDWGTEQRATIGQNQTAPEWTVRWILTPIQANTLDAFLAERAKKGEWFLWTAPGTTQSRYRCDDWLHTFYDYKWRQFQASFRQVYSYNLPSMAAGTGYFVLTGFRVAPIPAILRPTTAGFTLSGSSAALAKGYLALIALGAFALTGTGITVARSWRLGAAAGSFVFIGNDAALVGVEVEQLLAAPAAFALTGADVSFIRASAGGDPYFNFVRLLLHCDGADNSTTFTDSSSDNLAITVAGSAKLSTAVTKFGTASANFASGTNANVTTAANTLSVLIDQDFTVEFWVYPTQFDGSLSGSSTYGIAESQGGTDWMLSMGTLSGNRRFVLATDNANIRITHQTVPSLNVWQHIAIVRSATVFSVYIDGVKSDTSYTQRAAYNNSSFFSFGPRQSGSTNRLYMDDMRFTRAARYTATFTPPTTAFPDIIGVDSDAAAYIAAVESADGQSLEADVKTAINNFVVGCKADGIWTAMQASCILAGARTLSGALVPLIGTAPTNNNFVSGDYNRETGLVGDGSTKYLDSNRTGNADSQDSHHQAVWVTTASTSGTAYMGVESGANRNTIYNTGFGLRQTTLNAVGSNVVGLRAASRSGSTRTDWRTGATTGNYSTASTTATFGNIAIFARNNSGTVADHCNARLAFYSIGGSLASTIGVSTTSMTALSDRVNTLINAIAAAIP